MIGASSQASRTLDEKHSHALSKTNIQMCQDCHRFFIITYEKNEKGEAVETGYELDIRVVSSGVVKPQGAEWEPSQTYETYRRKKGDDHRELSCF